MLGQAGDIILVAGKGHETYQIVGREKLHFDDREELQRAFAELKK
jgi:UDP-N-acetylmuramoyl-L-alanyl-D-glutamate--2,6-diaminopimelate ligase